jgi:hypothetical protein
MPHSIFVQNFQDLNIYIGDIHNLILINASRKAFNLHMQFFSLSIDTWVRKIDMIVPMWIPFLF